MAKAQVSPAGDVYPAAEMHQWGVVNRLLPAPTRSTRDLPAGLESLLEQGPNQAIFEGR